MPALEEEVESLSRFETELEDVNQRCDRLVDCEHVWGRGFIDCCYLKIIM